MKDFKKYYVIPSEKELVYRAMTFEPTIELWTGSPADFRLEKDYEFSMWDDSISGKILDFEENNLIRQEWYFGESEIPSIDTLKLHDHKKGTSVEVEHTNIPDEAFDDITSGWTYVFMKGLSDFFRE